MKRTFAILLAAILLFGSFACRTTSDETAQAPDPTPEPTAETVETPAPTEAPTEAPTPEPDPTPEPKKTAADLWAELDNAFPALYSLSRSSLRHKIYDPAAFGIDPEQLLPIGCGSDEECEQYYADLRALLDRICEIDRFALDKHQQFAFNTVTESLKAELKMKDYQQLDASFLPSTGAHLRALNPFFDYRINSAEDIESYLAEIEYIPVWFDKLLTREKTRAEKGRFMTEFALDAALVEIDLIRKDGDQFFGYAYLGSCMKKLGMSEEEQAPYLERNKTAVDAVLQAYDTLYTELDGMRASCEQAITPYDSVPTMQNNERFSYYLAQLAQILGTSPQDAVHEVFSAYDAALAYLMQEFNEIDLPADFGQKVRTYRPASAQAMFNDTIVKMGNAYTPLKRKPNIAYLPDLDYSYLGATKWLYYYDHPEQSTLFFVPSANFASIAMRYVGCNNYFFRYFAENPDVSRAQILAAPESYYSGLGFYTALALLKEEGDKTGNYVEYYLLFTSFYQYLLRGYVANLIECGMPEEEIRRDLSQYYGLPDETIETVYQDARANPLVCIELSYGCAKLIELREDCRTKLRGRMNDRTFLKQYLSYGPSFPDMLEKEMLAWCDMMLNSGDA